MASLPFLVQTPVAAPQLCGAKSAASICNTLSLDPDAFSHKVICMDSAGRGELDGRKIHTAYDRQVKLENMTWMR
jgi:hypothetical protein